MTEDAAIGMQQVLDRFDDQRTAVLEIGQGWYPLITRLNRKLAAIAPSYVVQQVKSKFGALCFYATPSEDPYKYSEEFQAAIREAEWRSIETCEECGAPARQYVLRLWVWTLCREHSQMKAATIGG